MMHFLSLLLNYLAFAWTVTAGVVVFGLVVAACQRAGEPEPGDGSEETKEHDAL
jgi:hypothetical protein